MQEILVFIPSLPEDLTELLKNKQAIPVFVANQELMDTFGIAAKDQDSQEVAELAALQIASIKALTSYGKRFVFTAQIKPSQLSPCLQDSENGAMTLEGLQKNQLNAYFTDEPGHQPSDELINQLTNANLDQAWELAQDFLAENDLLWHSIIELAH